MSSIKKNYIYNTAYQCLTIIMPIITAPYISRVLGAENVGKYSYTYSIAYYFALFAMLGLNNYGNRQIAKVRKDKDELSRNFWSIYALQFCTSIIMVLIYVGYLCISTSPNRIMAIIQSIYLISVFFDINWFFFRNGKI